MRYLFVLCSLGVVIMLGGCGQDAINQQNREMLQQQQTQLNQLKQQVAALQAQRSYSTAAPAAGTCDASVLREATRKGGERFGAGDFAHALGYYQDAVTACGTSAQAQLNVARAYEALGETAQALTHYRLAAGSNGSNADADAARQAREALARLHG